MIRMMVGLMVLASLRLWALDIGALPPKVILHGDSGGTVDGKAWDTSQLRGKVHIVFYVDPDERSVNDALTQALKKERFDAQRFASTVVINLAATWMPNVVLESLLKKKQKEFPRTRYVKDKKKVLVRRWGLRDDAFDVLLFDRDGTLLYSKSGRLSDREIAQLIALIKKHL